MHELFRHEALPYEGSDRFVSTAVAAVREGLENDERTLVLATAAKVRELQDALGPDGDEVTFVASDERARNPAQVATILDTFRGGHGADGRHARGIHDSDPGRRRAVALEAQYADCLLNVAALRSWAISLVCLFDTGLLDDDARRAMRQGHGVVRGSDTNVDFDPELAGRLYATTLDPAPAEAKRTVVTAGGLPSARTFVRTGGRECGLVEDRVEDLVLAANEIVTNSLRYGGGTARLAMWFEDDAVVCDVRDRGFLEDPLLGRFAPPAGASSGRGLWLANNLCDLVQLRSSRAGTVVRLHVDR
jgi:anti-sigma regulatory factor (Ser/Thr protein kinase)